MPAIASDTLYHTSQLQSLFHFIFVRALLGHTTYVLKCPSHWQSRVASVRRILTSYSWWWQILECQFKILDDATPFFPFTTQVDIVISCCITFRSFDKGTTVVDCKGSRDMIIDTCSNLDKLLPRESWNCQNHHGHWFVMPINDVMLLMFSCYFSLGKKIFLFCQFLLS